MGSSWLHKYSIFCLIKLKVVCTQISQVPKFPSTTFPSSQTSQIPTYPRPQVSKIPSTQVHKHPSFQVPKFLSTQDPKFTNSKVPHSQVPKYSSIQIPTYPRPQVSKFLFKIILYRYSITGAGAGYTNMNFLTPSLENFRRSVLIYDIC